MFDPTDSEVLWLNLTNVALGLVTLVCLVAVVGIVLKEVTGRLRHRVKVPVLRDDHAFAFPDLGITMADGGERLDESRIVRSTLGPEPDESHIIRSEN
jgi:hypothetical protein